jgi:hypothetical protein
MLPHPVETESSLRSMLLDGSVDAAAAGQHAAGSRRLFTIRAADTDGHRSSARILVNRMYAWRGYSSARAPATSPQQSETITLIAHDHDATVGTLSIGFDGGAGLLVDELFHEEVQRLRRADRALCEFTKLAIDGAVRSKRVLASLFHMAFLCASEIGRCERILIEVNPRHVRYYQRMLGFELHGEERLNLRVNAPACLLSLDMAHAGEQIARFGGRPESALVERSLYPYFLSATEVAGILQRVQ